MPRLSHQTAVASLIQFLTLMFLGVPNTIVNIVSTCHNDSTSCVSNMIVSLILYILTAGWFGLILLFGYLAQRKRSRQIAVILIGFEFITLVVAGYINFPHDPNILAKATSLIDVLLSIWVIYLASRLIMSGGRRIVARPNPLSRSKRS